jgi:DNA mismatch endonuclease Vsr
MLAGSRGNCLWDAVISMDTLTPAERSARMALIRSKNTKPEMVVRRLLHGLGYRYRLHRKDLPGAPDLVFPARKTILFVHGCFWHGHEGCKIAHRPDSRSAYWVDKFERNKTRDLRNEKALRQAGWNVLTVWECETKDLSVMELRLASHLGPPTQVAEGNIGRG